MYEKYVVIFYIEATFKSKLFIIRHPIMLIRACIGDF